MRRCLISLAVLSVVTTACASTPAAPPAVAPGPPTATDSMPAASATQTPEPADGSAGPPSPAAASTARSSPTPTSSPTPAQAPDVLTTAGFGLLRFGQPAPASSGRTKESSDEQCGLTGEYRSTSGASLASYLTQNKQRNAPITVIFPGKQGQTRSGIKVGSSAAQVKRAYPQATTKPGTMTTMYLVEDSTGRVVIEVMDGKVVLLWGAHPGFPKISYYATEPC